MLKKIITIKNILVLFSIIMLGIIILGPSYAKKGKCLGASFITEEELQQKALNKINLGNIVLLNNNFVPYDKETDKIYLSCNISEGMSVDCLNGMLTSMEEEYKLYFLEHSFFGILSEAIKYNCTFWLYAIDAEGNYDSYEVVFTTLPIVEMHGECVGIDEEERELYAGDINVWESSKNVPGSLKHQSSNVEWHIRGNSTRNQMKKSYKITLKDGRNNNHLSLLGFERDDDYLLNAMFIDDTKIREKLTMSLWNEIARDENSSLKMSNGEYCELIINGEYLGLRLMQNRIDKKFLNLDENDILLKGVSNDLSTKKPEQVYEVLYSKDEQKAYRAMDTFFYKNDFSNVNLKNYIDVTLVLELGYMTDNMKHKNIYYLIKKNDNTLNLIPWDTDLSFGIGWNNEVGFCYTPENAEKIRHRMEYNEITAQYPHLEKQLMERWKELRANTFSYENIISKIDMCCEPLYKSGVLQRDYEVLGWYLWGGEDTIEKLIEYIEKRLEVLDAYYGVEL